MKLLGAVLAGGESRRFGSDKALAELDGQTLLDRALAALGPYCDALVIIGRECPQAVCVPDWPRPRMGPLGGLAGALNHAAKQGFDAVLTVPVDCGPLPARLLELLSPAPAMLESQPVIGLWPTDRAALLRDLLESDGSHAVRRFAAMIGARAVTGYATANINTPADLAALRSRGG